MDIEQQSLHKISAIIRQIESLLEGDFPDDAGRHALDCFKEAFEGHVVRVKKCSSNESTLRRAAILVNERIRELLPVIGFVLRSTHVRNNFEYYHSFQELATGLIGRDAQVILSSEWDYSPLTYPLSIPFLPEYVLIGMPASESFNALILPLAGHEFGHSVWLVEKIGEKIASRIEAASRTHFRRQWSSLRLLNSSLPPHPPKNAEINSNFFLADLIANVKEMALRQIEEIFCDAMGVAIFGESYLHAFYYLLAPGSGSDRNPCYPRLQTRADILISNGRLKKTSAVRFRKHFSGAFEEEIHDSPEVDLRLQTIADTIAQNEAPRLFTQAFAIVEKKIPKMRPSPNGTRRVLKMFEAGLPCAKPASLSDIVNAGWQYAAFREEHVARSERELFEWVSELILKTLEVLEFNRRTCVRQ